MKGIIKIKNFAVRTVSLKYIIFQQLKVNIKSKSKYMENVWEKFVN